MTVVRSRDPASTRTTGAPAFAYRDGILHAEDVPLTRVADAAGTPVYCYSSRALVDAYGRFAAALQGLRATVCFALKANSNLAVVRTFASLGAGADVVSEGELRRALAAGVAPEKIVFSGVGKTRAEMAFALAAGIGQFNVESEPELAALDEAARAAGRVAAVALRVNPDVDARTHAKITTGRSENKFGIGLDRAGDVYRRAAAMAGLRAVGLAVHIGSQLTSIEPFREAFGKVAALARDLGRAGFPVERLDLGGGLGVPYAGGAPADLDGYAEAVRQATAGLGCELVFEPGRLLTAQAGVLLSRVIYVKEGSARRFVIVDAAMNDLIRPALYDAYHGIAPVAEPAADAPRVVSDVVGPVCETGDVLAPQRLLPPLQAGDLVAIESAGAYGAVMASGYNTRPLVAEVMVRDARYETIRPRQSYDIILAQDRMPAWLVDAPAGRSQGTPR
jgi:diaminopimelate decarboxylase